MASRETPNIDVNRLATLANLEIDFSGSERSLLDFSNNNAPTTTTAAPLADDAPPASSGASSGKLYLGNPSSFSSESDIDRRASVDSANSTPPTSHSLRSSTKSNVSFGTTSNIRTNSLQLGASQRGINMSNNSHQQPAVVTAVAAMSDNESDLEDSNHDLHPLAMMHHQDSIKGSSSNNSNRASFDYPPSQQPPMKKKGVLKNNKAGPIAPTRKHGNNYDGKGRLTKVSAMYDLDGDGVLDEIEQAMRDRDIDGDGQLDNNEIKRIVQDQLKSQHDVTLYRKVSCGLLCLVAILAVSNFGTSWASAILASDTVADSESGTLQSKKSREVMGLQGITYEIELEELTDDEFDARRQLVDREMLEDPDHEDHHHRKLGRKNNKNHCACSVVGYDRGKIKERDLVEITRKCDGVNQVSIKRKWRNDVMEGYDYDVDTICGPGTQVVKKGRRKKNKNKTKVKVVEDQIKFRKKGRDKDGRDDKEISFECEGGYCYGSGKTLVQGLGHPCNMRKELEGYGECDEDLVCLGSGSSGVCTALIQYAKRNQVCDIDFGLDACDVGYACYSTSSSGGNKNKLLSVGVVRTGLCQAIVQRGRDMEVCDASYDSRACDSGYICLGANGRDLERNGIGFCTRLVHQQRNNGVCDLSYANDACADGYYCHDSMLTGRSGGGGNGGGVGGSVSAYTGVVIAGPSGVIDTTQGGSASTGVRSPRTTGAGMCKRSISTGGNCSDDWECGYGFSCVGLGADTATGGKIVGSSGVIVWGTGGATTGYCG